MAFRLLALAVVMVLLAACGGTDEAVGPEGSPSPTLRRGTAIIETDDGAVMVEIEVADTPETRAVGLMHRESLPENAGMLFLYFEDTTGGFYMLNTLIPLSIAFFDHGGKILKILDMDTCTDTCPTYDPGVPYRGALEVNQGAFEEWGVEVGDVIRVSP